MQEQTVLHPQNCKPTSAQACAHTTSLSVMRISAITSNAALVAECKWLLKLVFLFSSDKYPEVELLDHRAALLLIFWRTSIPFSVRIKHFEVEIAEDNKCEM